MRGYTVGLLLIVLAGCDYFDGHEQRVKVVLEVDPQWAVRQAGGTQQNDREAIVVQARRHNMQVLARYLDEFGIRAEPRALGDKQIEVYIPASRYSESLLARMTRDQRLSFQLVSEHEQTGLRSVEDRQGRRIFLKPRPVISGAHVVDATVMSQSRYGRAAATVVLDEQGAERMQRATRNNIGREMAVVLIMPKFGESLEDSYAQASVLMVARIQDVFGKRFLIDGFESEEEAYDMVYRMRAGEMAAPMRTVSVEPATQ